MKSKSRIKIVIWVLGALAFLPAVARPDAAKETVITADSLVFDYQRSIAVFEGNVRVVDGQITLTCKKLHVYFDANNQVDSVVARENVHVIQGNREGRAGRAVYQAKKGSIVLTENASLSRENDRLKGDEIQIFTQSEKVISKPARLVVFPAGPEGVLPR